MQYAPRESDWARANRPEKERKSKGLDLTK